MVEEKDVSAVVHCSHCGDDCSGNHPTMGVYSFCCNGCHLVWNLLHESGLSEYYTLETLPGINASSKQKIDYSFLDNSDIAERLISFSIGETCTVFLQIPQIHCTACIWLLEHLHQLNPGIKNSRVNFFIKRCTVVFDRSEVNLSEIINLLDKIGYVPELNFDQLDKKSNRFIDNSLVYKIGVAGFCFGNIMLFSFPDYLGLNANGFENYFAILNIALALPIVLYTGKDYIDSAWQSIKMSKVGIDMPIAIGILTLFFRSVFEIMTHTGPGYLDSLSGFVLFLLVGRWFQARTFQSLSFDRDYRSFFPIAVKTWEAGNWKDQPIDQLRKNDRILIRNEEIIPCDGILVQGNAKVDYSFVSGESNPVHHRQGDIISSGGKQQGGPIELRVSKEVQQSKLTQLWNEDIFNKRDVERENILLNRIGKYFTLAILVLAFTTLFYWLMVDAGKAFNTFTSVLIVACPCVLALSVPFIYGNALGLLSKYAIYCKNVFTLFDLRQVDTIVFDKTGTITDSGQLQPRYRGKELSSNEKSLIKSLCFNSNHLLSQSIYNLFLHLKTVDLQGFNEIVGAGLVGYYDEHKIRIGSAQFILEATEPTQSQTVFIEIDEEIKGHFTFENVLRPEIEDEIGRLSENYNLAVISGDNSDEKRRMEDLFPEGSEILFNKSPHEKLDYISRLQERGAKVMMVGDGLNDAGALKRSNVGLVITSQGNNFTPASDVIMSAKSFAKISSFLNYARNLKYALFGAFFLAFLYNTIGLLFAVSGHLTPVVAAILMPASSISILLYGLVTSQLLARIKVGFQ